MNDTYLPVELQFIQEHKVKIWFQNRRTKWKKQDNISNAEAAEHKNQNNPKTTPVKSKHSSGTGVKEVDPLRPSVDCSSDSNNSLLISDVSVSDSDPANQRISSIPTGPERSMHLSPSLGLTTGHLAHQNRRALSPDSVYISRSYDSDLQLMGDDHLENSGISPTGILKEYDIKRDQKIVSRDLVAGKGESRTPGIQEPNEDSKYDPQKKVSLLSTERNRSQKMNDLENTQYLEKKIDRLEKKVEPVEFGITPAVTRLVTSDREPEVLENHERDFDEEPSSPQSALQIDEREERMISPELPS